ncbi:MAG: pectin acetylesterase-family hydrolase [Chloroflexota bacterium]
MLKKTLSVLLFLCLGITGRYSIAQDAAAQSLPTLADLKDTWNAIIPGGDTLCSKGTPFSFFVHPGKSDKLLIYFDGGGMCWDEKSCATQPSFTDAISVTADKISNGYGGIFDLNNPENPFADDSMVFVPYCTADMHMGNSIQTYGTGDKAVEIHHNGFVNDQAALNWTYANFESPERVFITGVSAGSPGAIFQTPFIMEHYKDVPISELGDSGGGWYAPKGEMADKFTQWGTISLLPDWVKGFGGLTAETLSFEKLYTAVAAQYPNNLFAEYNTAHDQVQNTFVGSMISPAYFYNQTLPASLAEISAEAPNFGFFTAGGNKHGIIGGDEFYGYAIGELRFRDWVNDLASGILPDSIVCKVCYEAETVASGG